MASDPSPALTPADPTTWTHRLAEQLRSLSEMGEALTYRLLELEERLASHELRVAPLLEQRTAVDNALAEDIELRMGDTEERLARIEAVLNGLERPGPSRHLQPLRAAQPTYRLADSHPAGRANGMEEEDLFLEEGEQPFMDELPA